MWNSSLKIDKYEYVRTHPYAIKTVAALGIVTSLLMGYGLWQFIQLSPYYMLLFGPIALILVTNKLLRYSLQLFYRRLDPKKHEKFIAKYWTTHKEPKVDVFLPWAGEDLDMHEEVLKALDKINYKNVRVYMLDDVGSPDHKALSKKYGFSYLSRPNKGQYKKSGNLEYGYAHSKGEYVLILDADFIPSRDILRDLVPYIDQDPSIGILQTPQYFDQGHHVHKKSRIEFGGGNIVEEFYKIVMPCRDEFQAAMCVGTSALYRRTAIEKLEGTPKVHASEDLATGLLITQHGYHVKYLPLIVSMGKSPETYQGYFKQHMRWCSGNLVFAEYWPKARLNLVARLIYVINPLYYLSEALSIIFSFQFLFLLYYHTETLSLQHVLYFLPYIILSRLIVPALKTNKSKVGTKLAALNNTYTYFYTYIRMLVRGVPTWQPTGVKVHTLHQDFIEAINLGTTISAAYTLLFAYVLLNRTSVFGNYNTYMVLAWSFYSVFWHVYYLYSVFEYIRPFKLSVAKNAVEKWGIYVRSHMPLALFSVLIGVASFNGYLTVTNPDTLYLIDTANVESATFSAPAMYMITSQSMVLGAATEILPEFTYVYEQGDTAILLAERALTDFANKQSTSLSSNQLNYAAHDLLKHAEKDSQKLKRGDLVSFSPEELASSLEKAQKNVEN